MRFIVLFIAVFWFQISQSQNNRDYNFVTAGASTYTVSSNWYIYRAADTFISQKGISSVRQCSFNNKKPGGKQKPGKCYVTNYNSSGHIISEWREGKNGSEENRGVYAFNDSGNLISAIFGKPGKGLELRYEYDEKNQMLSQMKLKKGKIKRYSRYIYDQKGHRISSFHYLKDTNETFQTYLSWYENDTGRLIRTESRDRKGKLIYAWDYTCAPAGELSKTEQKKETRVCTNDHRRPDGYREVVYEQTVFNELIRTIYVYDTIDRLISFQRFKGTNAEILQNEARYDYTNSGHQYQYTSYSGDGIKVSDRYIYEYNLNKQVLSRRSEYYRKSGKLRTTWETGYTYNDGILVRTNGSNPEKPGKESVVEYTHTYLAEHD